LLEESDRGFVMECKNIQDLLSAYLEGIITPEENRLVEKHLASCKQCGEALEDLTRTGELVHNLKEVEPPPWFTQKIMAQVREEAEKKSGILERLFYPLRIKVPIQALATALIVVMAFYVYRSVEPEMKLAQAPAETARTITKDAVREQNGKAGASSVAVESETALKEQRGQDKAASTVTPQETSAPSGSMADSTRAKKGEAVADRHEQEMRVGAAPPSQKEVPQLQKGATASPAPSAAPKEADTVASAGAQVKDTRERKAVAPAGEMKAFAAKKTEPLGVMVRVSDVAAAAPQVQNILVQLGARNIARESREGAEVITAELAIQKAGELFRKLSTLGRVEEKDSRPAITDGDVPIRIEVIDKP
jgi:anti-sigma factor RsiW